MIVGGKKDKEFEIGRVRGTQNRNYKISDWTTLRTLAVQFRTRPISNFFSAAVSLNRLVFSGVAGLLWIVPIVYDRYPLNAADGAGGCAVFLGEVFPLNIVNRVVLE